MALRTDLTRPRRIVGAMLGAALCVAASAMAETTTPAGATQKAKPAQALPSPHPVMTVENAAAMMQQAVPTPKPVAIAKPAMAPNSVPAVAAAKPAPVKAKDWRFADVKSAGSHGRPVPSPDYAISVTAFRAQRVTQAPKHVLAAVGKPMTPATPSTPAKTPPAAATFNERMSRTTVTPPVMTSGAKAANLHPAPPAQSSTVAMAPAKLAAVQSPPSGTKQAWHFREVATASSSTANVRGAVALTAVKPTMSYAKPAPVVAVTSSLRAKPPAAKPVPAAETSPAPQFAAVKSGASSSPVRNAKPAPANLGGNVAIASVKTTLTTREKRRSKAPLTTSVQNLGARFMERREQYVYNSLNRRDPYASLVSGAFEGEVGTPLLDVSSMKLVGIVWGSSDKFALVEDGHGHGFVLRVGDPVLNGYVAGLTKEELIVKQSSYGDTQTVTIQLQRKEGASNAN